MTQSTMTSRGVASHEKASVVHNGVTAAAPCEKTIDPANQTPEQFMDACEEAIRELAYQKWEEAGCPSGDGFEFWVEAEREIVAARTDAMQMRP